MRSLLLLIFACTFGFASVTAKTEKKSDKKYDETSRPQFHFSPEKGIMSNPNGLVFYDGEYHLFFQYQPDTTAKSANQWGHAVSKDLIRWDHLEGFIVPDKEGKGYCVPGSGSAVVDENNLTGLQQGSDKTILLYYTGWECGQSLAYSNDKGRTWKQYEKNPILAPDKDAASGPKVFFDKTSGNWVMTLFRKPEGDDSKQGISIYNSKDMLKWEFQSHTQGFNGSADLFPLATDGDASKTLWILAGGNNEYQTGKFDGKTFTPESSLRRIDYGRNFQAARVWSNHPEGKIIQIAWMRGGNFPDMPFNGQMSFPCELSLRTTQAGILLCRNPVESITALHDKNLNKKEKNIIPGIKGNLVGGINGEILHIKAKLPTYFINLLSQLSYPIG